MTHISDILLERLLLSPHEIESDQLARLKEHLGTCDECQSVFSLVITLRATVHELDHLILADKPSERLVLAAATPVEPVKRVEHLFSVTDSGQTMGLQILMEHPSGDWLIYPMTLLDSDSGPILVRMDGLEETVLVEPGKGTRIPAALVSGVDPAFCRMRAHQPLMSTAFPDTHWCHVVGDRLIVETPARDLRTAYYSDGERIRVAESPRPGLFSIPLESWKPGNRVWMYG